MIARIRRLIDHWRALRVEEARYRADQERIARFLSMSNHPAGRGRV